MRTRLIAIGMTAMLVLCAAFGAVTMMNSNNDSAAEDDSAAPFGMRVIRQATTVIGSPSNGGVIDLTFDGVFLHDDKKGLIYEDKDGNQIVFGDMDVYDAIEFVYFGGEPDETVSTKPASTMTLAAAANDSDGDVEWLKAVIDKLTVCEDGTIRYNGVMVPVSIIGIIEPLYISGGMEAVQKLFKTIKDMGMSFEECFERINEAHEKAQQFQRESQEKASKEYWEMMGEKKENGQGTVEKTQPAHDVPSDRPAIVVVGTEHAVLPFA